MTMPTLFVMIGCPGSGKSTWAKAHQQLLDAEYVSRDAIRFAHLSEGEDYFAHENETFAEFINEIASGILLQKNVIADASHLNRASRQKLYKALDKTLGNYPYEIICVCMKTSLRDSLAHNALRTGRACVPEDVVVDMYEHMTKPEWGEHKNFREVWMIEVAEKEGV